MQFDHEHIDLRPLFESLYIKPRNISLYIEALTHPSYKNIKNLNYDYQRLEFIGDVVIEKCVREYLFKKYPEKDEGEMTKIKIMIVQSHTEVLAAKQLKLNNYVMLQNSLVDENNNIPDKILEDSFEALIAAIYFDLGEKQAFNVLKRTIIHLYEIHYLDKQSADYKSLIQEAMQKFGKRKIQYKFTKMFGENNKPEYKVELIADGICYGVGYAQNKKGAEKNAAMNAYNKLAKK